MLKQISLQRADQAATDYLIASFTFGVTSEDLQGPAALADSAQGERSLRATYSEISEVYDFR